MPEEITPVWIDGWYDSQAQAASDMREGLDDLLGRYVYPVQALTLDQIEAWLLAQTPVLGNKAEYLVGYGDCINALLAQVQAWKEKP